jgi:hypothetical protein
VSLFIGLEGSGLQDSLRLAGKGAANLAEELGAAVRIAAVLSAR